MRSGQGTGGARVSLCLQGVSQPDLGVGWHGRGVVKAGGSEQVPSRIGGGAGPACGSKCISVLHPSGPHAHVWVEALLAPLLPVARSVKGQLANEHLHLAWWQEPRTAVIQVCATGEGRGQCRGAPAWSPGSVCSVA